MTARMIQTGHDVEVMNPELLICSLDTGARLSMELTVETGKGYAAASSSRAEEAPIGLIPIDAIYSPVRKVAYKVENTRVGQVTDHDKLSLEVTTNGALTPEDAVAVAARILQDQLQLFINFEEPQAAVEEERRDELPFNRNLLRKVDELELSVRSANCPIFISLSLPPKPSSKLEGMDASPGCNLLPEPWCLRQGRILLRWALRRAARRSRSGRGPVSAGPRRL